MKGRTRLHQVGRWSCELSVTDCGAVGIADRAMALCVPMQHISANPVRKRRDFRHAERRLPVRGREGQTLLYLILQYYRVQLFYQASTQRLQAFQSAPIC